MARTANVLAAHPSVPAADFKALIAYAKKFPGKLSYASFGNGTTAHFAGEMLKVGAGIDMVHIPYKGQGPALQDLLAGNVDIMFGNLPDFMPHIRAGKLKAYAVSTRGRASQLPNVPSVIETGVVDFEAGSWMGLYAPAATPAPIVERLRSLADQLVRSPEFAARIESTGGAALVIPGNRQNQFQAEELARWDRLIKQTGIQLDL
jgi:tripartite-type tricarboxylate transporter receptor subunit TctC